MARKIIDPITRIEGHLRIEIELDDNNTVTNAWSSGTLWRGMEIILKDRPPQDAPLFTQRICGVCTYSHYEASTLANEAAFGVAAPKNARLVRNLIKASQWLHDHPVHFYVLHGLDWVDITKALEADPEAAAALAKSTAELTGVEPYNATAETYTAVQKRLKAFVDSGHLGPFANGYWGHPAYKLSNEANLVITSHYLDVLSVQRIAAQAMAVLGGKNPHPQSLIVGGVTSVLDALDSDRLDLYLNSINQVKDFVERAYLPDVLLAAATYKTEQPATTGAGVGNFLSYGCFPQSEGFTAAGLLSDPLFPSGVITDADLTQVAEVDPLLITEHVKHSWYEGEAALYPGQGETNPNYTGYDANGNVDGDNKYSWVKAPRYNGLPTEVGPLARMLVGYVRGALGGDTTIKDTIDTVLDIAGLVPTDLLSTLGRTAARCAETVILGTQIAGWVDELKNNTQSDTKFWEEAQIPETGEGFGLTDVPRGALGHWINIADSKIANYQAVVPSTWNASPRDADDQRGPYEESLIGLTLADADKPLEVIRVIHSFDPCLACAIHLITPRGDVKKFQISKVG